jgi:hypothetical protein
MRTWYEQTPRGPSYTSFVLSEFNYKKAFDLKGNREKEDMYSQLEKPRLDHLEEKRDEMWN